MLTRCVWTRCVCVDKLCVDKLCVWTSKFCVDSCVCVDKLERRRGGEAEVQNQKQEPHTKMWGIILNPVAPSGSDPISSTLGQAIYCHEVHEIPRRKLVESRTHEPLAIVTYPCLLFKDTRGKKVFAPVQLKGSQNSVTSRYETGSTSSGGRKGQNKTANNAGRCMAPA